MLPIIMAGHCTLFIFLLLIGSISSNIKDRGECYPPTEFLCKNQRCISMSFLCNGENDCGDDSDETIDTCPEYKIEPKILANCTKNEYKCKDNLQCIPMEMVCDYQEDCLDASDEINCFDKVCPEFKCHDNDNCIKNIWICDGENDCSDGSDELNCDKMNLSNVYNCTYNNNKYLCSNNECISIELVCDNKNDCYDHSDEDKLKCQKASMKCSENNLCSSNQLCKATPNGPICTCHLGSIMLNNGTCQDINECIENYGICEQICVNIPGSYYCECSDGYKLENDKRSCKSDFSDNEALLVFASKSEIRGYYLESEVYFLIAHNLSHVVGVSLDTSNVYWTDVTYGEEAIYRSNSDGTKREQIVISGIGSAEEIDIDWITGNVYFTDSIYRHIAVCTPDGYFCTVLINKGTEKPRGISILPSEGKIYWSDWGQTPHISVADMDGKNQNYFVKDNIKWPNGITIDIPSKRLYWVDAKKKVIESVTLDGNDRRQILGGVAKHPYSIAIFNERLYWSDWMTNSIQSCNKISGKDFKTIFVKNETIYGVHISHPSLRIQYDNPCESKPCSELCLLSVNRSYSCSCTIDKTLSTDGRTCLENSMQRQHIAIVAGNLLIDYKHEIIGRPTTKVTLAMEHINSLAYDSLDGSLIIADDINKSIFRLDSKTQQIKSISKLNDKHISDMSFDYFGNNIYKTISNENKIEIFNLNTNSITEIYYDEKPYDIVLLPEEGVMFVVFVKYNKTYHIDIMKMNGLGQRNHVIETGLVGPRISLAYDKLDKRVYWSDEGTGRIESVGVTGKSRRLFRSDAQAPVSITLLNSTIFWTERYSKRLNWIDRLQTAAGNKSVDLVSLDTFGIPLLINTNDVLYLESAYGIQTNRFHPCQTKNGGCSHVCLVTNLVTKLCACPPDYSLNLDEVSCSPKSSCAKDELKCTLTDKCIKSNQRCNGVSDCPHGEDEANCGKSICSDMEFTCKNGECVDNSNVCDNIFHCKDHSDEENCESQKCKAGEFLCKSGKCIPQTSLCNGLDDCGDFSDEQNCKEYKCDEKSFKCLTGGMCVPKNMECDMQKDCSDGSDEHEECKLRTCNETMFKCKNGACIDYSLRCDGTSNCRDYSDEDNCAGLMKTKAFVCSMNQYKCKNNDLCIDLDLRCNGKTECPLKDDEYGCGLCNDKNDKKQFKCKNGNCIPIEWLCDYTDDCGDSSDEFECQISILKPLEIGDHNSTKFIPKKCDEFTCTSDNKCILYKNVCDGKKDCQDGSDENGNCDKACKQNSCKGPCFKTPSGPKCTCSSGYKLDKNKKSCIDIDECKLDYCQQKCQNLQGSFKCSCYDGFILKNNQTYCKSIGPPMKLIFSINNELKLESLYSFSLNSQSLYNETLGRISGLDVDSVNNEIYWTNEIVGTINKIDINNLNVTQATRDIGMPKNLALDWITKISYIYDTNSSTIKACDINVNKCAKVIKIDENYNLTAITIDPLNGLLFWSQINNKTNISNIMCSSLIGENQKIIINNLGYIDSLAIDLYRKILYFSDIFHKSVEYSDYLGNNHSILVKDTFTTPANKLNFYENSIYWQIGLRGSIVKCDLFGNKTCSLYRVNEIVFDQYFVISQISKQPKGNNPCNNNKCDYMCIVNNNEALCIKESASDLTHHEKMSIDTNENSKINNYHSYYTISAIRLSVIIILVIIIILAATVYYKNLWVHPVRQVNRYFDSVRFEHRPFRRKHNLSRDVNNEYSGSTSNVILVPNVHEFTNPIIDIQNDNDH